MTALNVTRAWFCLLGVLCGATGLFGYYHRPQAPDAYTVTAKAACLPADGVSFSLEYSGHGVATFKVVPPNTGAKPEEKKQ